VSEVAPVSPAGRPRAAPGKDPLKSRITNGSALLPGVDGRSPWVRRCKDVIAAHISDMGGEDNTSAAERSIVRRAATMTVELERLESRFALAGQADPVDLDLYQRTAGNLRRLLEAVGLQRRARDVTPTLTEYLKAARVAATDAELGAAPPTAVSPRIARNELPGVQMPGDAESAAVSEIGDHGGLANEGGAT
jgi:hypothetical protein